MKTTILAVLLMAGSTAFAGDAEFERIVRAIENHYGTHPMHIPFMGLASLIVKVAHPEGATGLKLAVFEDLKSSPGTADWTERDAFMNSIEGPTLHPFVRVHSRRSGEATYIFMEGEGKSTRILVAVFERNEATIVEVKANVDQLLRSMDEPGHARHILAGKRNHGDTDE